MRAAEKQRKEVRDMMYSLFCLRKLISFLAGTVFGNLLFLLNGVHRGGVVKCFGMPSVEKRPGGRISIGARGVLKSSQVSSFMGLDHPCKLSTLAPGAEIVIGDGFQTAVLVCNGKRNVFKFKHSVFSSSTIVLYLRLFVKMLDI